MTYRFYRFDEIHWDASSLHLLDTAERQRYESAGLNFLRTRLILKELLAHHASCDITDIQLAYGEQGKPYLPDYPELHFNMSHTAELLVIAIDQHPIGIDIELMRPRRNLTRLASRIMTEESYERFIQKGAQIEDFYAHWCVCEALIKQAGSSIWCAEQFPFVIREGAVVLGFECELRVELLQPCTGVMGAIAYVPCDGV